MKTLSPASIVVALLLTTSCSGPLIVDDDARQSVPSAVAPENSGLKGRSKPLEVGAAVPPFTLLDQKEIPVSSDELTSGKGSVIVFVPLDRKPGARPAYGWARKNQSFLSQHGLELLLVSPESTSGAAAIAERESLRMAILSDPMSWVARACGAASTQTGTPEKPSVFVLGSNGRIQYAQPGLAEPSELVMAAESLPGTAPDSLFGF